MKEKTDQKYISLQQSTCTQSLKISLSLQVMGNRMRGCFIRKLYTANGYLETVNIKLDSKTPPFLFGVIATSDPH